MDRLTLFGLFAVGAMLVFYALEDRARVFTLGFSIACLCGSAYGFLQGAGPFGLVEAIWAGVAAVKWWRRPRPSPEIEADSRGLEHRLAPERQTLLFTRYVDHLDHRAAEFARLADRKGMRIFRESGSEILDPTRLHGILLAFAHGGAPLLFTNHCRRAWLEAKEVSTACLSAHRPAGAEFVFA